MSSSSSNNNEAAEPNDNNNEQLNHNNQNNAPEWGAFPDLLRVQEPQQNGGGVPEAGVALQRAGVANPPDVSLPGAAGRDPPPPDFDIDPSHHPGMLQNQRLPDMALDANQSQGQLHSLPDMALDAGQRSRAAGASCSGARFRARRSPDHNGSPGSLAQMAQAVAAGVSDNGIDNQRQGDSFRLRLQELENQVQALRLQSFERDRLRAEESARILDELSSLRRVLETPRENSSMENRLINIESLIQRMVSPHQNLTDDAMRAYRVEEERRQRRETERVTQALAESLQIALTHFLQRLNQNNDTDERP